MTWITEQEYLEAVEDARSSLIATAASYCKVRADAEDAVQEAVVYCLGKLGDYDPMKASLITWITTAVIQRAKNTNYYHIRDQEQAPGFEDDGDGTTRRAQKKAKSEPEEGLYDPKYELVLDVQKAMSLLPEDEREAIKAVMLEGYTESEYSESANIPRRTVTRQIARAKEKLRDILKDWNM